MAVVRAIESIKPVLTDGVRCWETHELLAVLLHAAGVDARTIDGLALAVDSGVLRAAATMPDTPSMDDVLPGATAAVLAAAFELTRRAALPHAPTVIRGPADVAAIARRELGGSRREHVLVIACDAGNRPLRSVVVAHGAVDRVSVSVREILTAVLRCDGRAFALAHNHPCGDPEPSDADVEVTESVAEAARAVGLRFLGHVAVGRDDYRTVESISESRKRR